MYHGGGGERFERFFGGSTTWFVKGGGGQAIESWFPGGIMKILQSPNNQKSYPGPLGEWVVNVSMMAQNAFNKYIIL